MLNFVKVSLNMLRLCNGSLVEELGRQKNKERLELASMQLHLLFLWANDNSIFAFGNLYSIQYACTVSRQGLRLVSD